MRYFIDTEFNERGPSKPIELISIGIVAEDGREYYAINASFNRRHATPWVKDNVLTKLPDRFVSFYDSPRIRDGALRWKPYATVGAEVSRFIGHDPNPVFWGWCSGYDYVVLSQLIGFHRWPDGWPHYIRDIQQVIDESGRDVSEVESANSAHTAIEDAREIKRIWEYLAEKA